MSSAGDKLDWRALTLLALFALVTLAPGISSLPPTDRDESRYAVSATQMAESGDVVDIRFMDEPRYLQPAGVYWLQAASARVLGAVEAREIWAYRLPSLAGAMLAVLLAAMIGAQLFGRTAGLAAGVLLAASFSLGFEARIAKTDAALLAAIAAAQWALLKLYLAAPSSWRLPALFWVAISAGLMIKGPIILIYCGATVITLLIWDRRAAWLTRLRAHWGVPLMLALVLPWFVAIGVVSDGYFYARSVGQNLLGKVGQAEQSHSGPPGYHLAAFTAAFWPGSLMAALAIPFAWRRRAEPAVRFLIAWIVPGWVIYELVATKLPHYVLPTYPAIACLAAAALFAPAVQQPWWARAAGGVYALAWLAASALLAGLAPAAIHYFDARVDALAAGLGAAAFVLAAGALAFTLLRQGVRAVACAGAAALLVGVNTYAVALPGLANFWLSPRIEAAARAACADGLLVTTIYREPSLVFLHGPARTRFADSPAEAAALAARAPGCAAALVTAEERAAFVAAARAAGFEPRPAGDIGGRNYSNGDDLSLALLAR